MGHAIFRVQAYKDMFDPEWHTGFASKKDVRTVG